MPSITRCDVSISTNKNVSVCNGIADIESHEYYTFTMYDKTTLKEFTVDIFVGKPYQIIFYNTETQGVSDVTGKVTRVSKASITIESIHAIDDYTCLCERRKYLNNVVTVYTATIPVTNIYSITAVEEEDMIEPVCPKPPTERTVTVVGVLGLSAEIIRSVVVRLRIYSDDRAPTYEAVPVDMTVGSVYKVTYFNRRDGAVYEIIGKLLDIQEAFKFQGDNKSNGFVRDELPPHPIGEEIVGYGNTVYDRDHFFGLSKTAPEAERIYFVFDTSDDFSGTYDKVWLKDIRNVEFVSTPEDEEDDGQTPDSGGDDTDDEGDGTCPCPCPPEHEIPGPFPHQAHWDGPPRPIAPPPPPPPPRPPFPREDVTHAFCPLNLGLPVSQCNCAECDQVDTCKAFEDFCNGD